MEAVADEGSGSPRKAVAMSDMYIPGIDSDQETVRDPLGPIRILHDPCDVCCVRHRWKWASIFCVVGISLIMLGIFTAGVHDRTGLILLGSGIGLIVVPTLTAGILGRQVRNTPLGSISIPTSGEDETTADGEQWNDRVDKQDAKEDDFSVP